MCTLLVIGGSGFFGKSILDAYRRGLLMPWGIERIVIVSRRAGDLRYSNPELISKNIVLQNLDITTAKHLPAADYIIHLAASTDARNYQIRPIEEVRNIQLGTLNFCNLINRSPIKSKIIYASSGAVYGNQPATIDCIDENFTFQKLRFMDQSKHDYADSKRISECYIQDLGKKGLNVSIARCFSFIGPYLPRDQHFAIGNFIEDGLKGNCISVKAKHSVYRSYLYADDLVLWLMKILESANPACPIFNVGSDQEILLVDLATLISNYFGVKVSYPKQNKDIVDRYIPNIDKSIQIGCVKPKNISESIDETVIAIKNLSHLRFYRKK